MADDEANTQGGEADAGGIVDDGLPSTVDSDLISYFERGAPDDYEKR